MPFTPSKDVLERREKVRKAYLEEHLTPKQISEKTGTPLKQVYRHIKALGKLAVHPFKDMDVPKEDLFREMRKHLDKSVKRREHLIEKCLEIVDGPASS